MAVTARAIALTTGAVFLIAAPALADQQFQARPTTRYAAASLTIAQGERLTFANKDTVQHDITSDATADGQPLFSSPLVSPGGEATVDGTQYLTSGNYTFHCSVHPFMKATLIVSSAGTPVPRTGSAVKPLLKASRAKLSSVKKSWKLSLTLTGTPGAGAKITASTVLSGKKTRLASRAVTLGSSGRKRFSVTISSKLRKTIAKTSKLTISFKATTTENPPQAATTKRTYS